MSNHAPLPQRRSTRLPNWDYAEAGVYFVTLNAHRRVRLFGKVNGGQVALSACGTIAHEEWLQTSRLRPNLELDAFVVMPDHLHGIIRIINRAVPWRRKHGKLHREAGTLGSILAGYKAACTSRINELRRSPGRVVWQRGYYEHVVRSPEALARVRRYIELNPSCWPD